MFLTQMPLNPQRRTTRELVGSPQRMHAAVLSAFPPGSTANADGRTLWRLDSPERHRLDLFIVSPVPPSLEAMADQAGWPALPEWRTANYAPFLDKLAAGQRWVFRLRANPIKSVRPPGGGRGSRVPLLRVEDQIEWLQQRATGHGFTIPVGEHGLNVRVSARGTERFARGKGEARTGVTLAMATYDGVLDVLDPSILRSALVTGIGAGKGYGCGLLTLAPG